MRSYLPSYELRRVADVDEALGLMAREPGRWRPFAGGTDVMVMLEAGTLRHQEFINLWGLRELRRIETTESALSIGALATYTDLLRDSIVRSEFPLLCDAASQTGGVATQNRGTLGGNVANASPAADTPPALLVYDAELELRSARGTRRVPYHRFHTAYKVMDLQPDEIISRVLLPRGREWIATYRKVGTRRAQAISKVCFAAAAHVQQGEIRDVRISFGSVAPTVVRAVRTEDAIRGTTLGPSAIDRALEALDGEIRPIDDVRSNARYRGFVARQLLRAFLQSLAT